MAAKKVVTPNTDIIDVDLSIIRKKRFRINKDDNSIIELNTSDMGIIPRIEEAYPKLIELQSSIADTDVTDDSDETFSNIATTLSETNKKMCDLIDYIFNSNVSEVCGRDGSMYDPIEGSFRFEHILSALMPLYTENLDLEFDKIKSRVNKYAKK